MNEWKLKTGCPPIERLASLVDGVLPDRERKEMIAHLLQCEICYEVAGESMQIRQSLEADQQAGVQEARVQGWERWIRIGFAAAAVFLIAFLLSVREKHGPSSQSPAQMASPGGAPIKPAPPKVVAPSEPPVVLAPKPEIEAVQRDFLASLTQFSKSLPPPEPRLDREYGFSPAQSMRKTAYITGVELSRLELAILQNDRVSRQAIGLRVARLLESLGETGEATRVYRAQAQSLRPRDYRRVEEAFMKRGLETEMKWGEWLQSSAFAAAARHSDFFNAKDADYFARALPVSSFPRGAASNLSQMKKIMQRLSNETTWKELETLIRDTMELTALSL